MAKLTIHRLNRNLSRRLREARQENGLSMRAVRDKLPKKSRVSHATLASYERGDSLPGLEVLTALAQVYGRTLNWFMDGGDELTGFRYRNLKSQVRLKQKRQYEANAAKWVDAYVALEKRLGNNLRKSSTFRGLVVTDDVAPQSLAQSVRDRLGLEDNDPVENVIEVLEGFAVRVIELATTIRIDGLAARRGESFVVVLNPSLSSDRVRLNAGHELAHVLYDDCKEDHGWTDDAVEKRAYEFASALLLPDSQLAKAFEGKSFLKLIRFKEKFGLSLSAMIYRAEKKKIIKSTTARWLWVEMSKRGWKKDEPGYVWRDRAVRLETMLESAIQTRELTWSDAAQVTGIDEETLKQRIYQATNVTGGREEDEDEEPKILSMF